MKVRLNKLFRIHVLKAYNDRAVSHVASDALDDHPDFCVAHKSAVCHAHVDRVLARVERLDRPYGAVHRVDVEEVAVVDDRKYQLITSVRICRSDTSHDAFWKAVVEGCHRHTERRDDGRRRALLKDVDLHVNVGEEWRRAIVENSACHRVHVLDQAVEGRGGSDDTLAIDEELLLTAFDDVVDEWFSVWIEVV